MQIMQTNHQTIAHLLSAAENLLQAVKVIQQNESAPTAPTGAVDLLLPEMTEIATVDAPIEFAPPPAAATQPLYTATEYLSTKYGLTGENLRKVAYRVSATLRWQRQHDDHLVFLRNELGTIVRTSEQFESILSARKGSIRRVIKRMNALQGVAE